MKRDSDIIVLSLLIEIFGIDTINKMPPNQFYLLLDYAKEALMFSPLEQRNTKDKIMVLIKDYILSVQVTKKKIYKINDNLFFSET